ncbi:MAG TPA: alpha-1,2-fucosyltransferase [Polyangia bacterium]|nr:alpha-1,2-fucosyltransferase [Polyangia bacterium]
MITFPELGQWGRLGNQLFQVAATVALAMEHGEGYGFPRWPYEGRFGIGGCFHDELLRRGPEHREKRFAWDPIRHQPGLKLYGFFQSEKYFGDFAPLIRRLLTPRVTYVRAKYLGVASVHVRRGDYLDKPDCHPPQTVEYYERAEAECRRAGIKEFLVFSDDRAWCRTHLAQRQGWRMSDPGDEVTHLSEMAACEAHVIANSSFSWWGAWLDPREQKLVVAPKDWFGPTLAPTHPTSDLIPSAWKVV